MKMLILRKGATLIIVDAHMHLIPAWYGFRNGVRAVVGEEYGRVRIQGKGVERWMPPSFTTSAVFPKMVLEYMNWIGIDKAVLMQAPVYGAHNEYVAQVLTKYPDKFRGFALMDPRDKKAPDKIDYLANTLKFCGVKFEVPDVPFWLDGREYWPLWEKILQENLLLALDLGWDKTENPYCFQVNQLAELVRNFPRMKVIVLHLGVSRLWDSNQKYPFSFLQLTLQLGEYPNVWFEISSLPLLCEEEEYPYPRAQQIIEIAYKQVGSKRIIWGSDFPTVLQVCTYRQTLNLIRNHCDFLTQKDKELILGKNALELYGFSN